MSRAFRIGRHTSRDKIVFFRSSKKPQVTVAEVSKTPRTLEGHRERSGDRMTSRRPSLPPMPDLSHLTEEERKVIEDVLRRQREEEEKELEIIR